MPDALPLLAVAVLSCACGPLGVWIASFRQAYAAESLAHALLPGLLLASIAGIPLLLGAAAGGAASAGVIAWAGRDPRVGRDVGVAVAVTGLLGLGGILALTTEIEAHEVEEALFGHLDDVSGADIAAAGAIALAVVTALCVLHRRLVRAALDPTASGPGSAVAVVLVLIAAATVAVAPVLGNLLVVAMLVAPGAAAIRLTGRVARAQLLSIPLGALAGFAGLLVAEASDWEAGACVAGAAVLVYLATALRSFAPK